MSVKVRRHAWAEVLRFGCLINRDYLERYRVAPSRHFRDVVGRWQRARLGGPGEVSLSQFGLVSVRSEGRNHSEKVAAEVCHRRLDAIGETDGCAK